LLVGSNIERRNEIAAATVVSILDASAAVSIRAQFKSGCAGKGVFLV
jgi:hypothetical protein